MFLKENRKNESLTLTCNSLSSFGIIFFFPPAIIHSFILGFHFDCPPNLCKLAKLKTKMLNKMREERQKKKNSYL